MSQQTISWRHLLVIIAGLSLPAWGQPLSFVDKKAFADRVLQRVGAAYGFDVLELPKLVLIGRRKGNRNFAKLTLATGRQSTDLYRSRLIMDEELFDVCTRVDKNMADPGTSLSFVIAHEMAHFYLKHASFRQFADQRGPQIERTEAIRQEQQADQTGLLFAYLAGYDPNIILDRLFNQLYAAYQLSDTLPGHPTKQKRQQTTKLDATAFQRYGYLFAVGRMLYCREQFAEAARCFEYVYSRYPLKEAYLNFGVCRLQEAVRLRKKTPILSFAFPFEADPRNRLLQLNERGTEEQTGMEAARVAGLLTEAKVAFQQAIQMDDRYLLAYLNQAIAELLSDNPYASLGVLDDWKRQSGRALPPNGYLIQSIAQYVLGDSSKAGQQMHIAKANQAYQATYNQQVLRAISQKPVTSISYQTLRPRKQSVSLGCQASYDVLHELDGRPIQVSFTTRLIELRDPPPVLIVEVGRAAAGTYFWLKTNPTNPKMPTQNRYFIHKVNRYQSTR